MFLLTGSMMKRSRGKFYAGSDFSKTGSKNGGGTQSTLSASNKVGCTECFCFGRSRECSQAPYSWTQVRYICSTIVLYSRVLTYTPNSWTQVIYVQYTCTAHFRCSRVHSSSLLMKTGDIRVYAIQLYCKTESIAPFLYCTLYNLIQ